MSDVDNEIFEEGNEEDMKKYKVHYEFLKFLNNCDAGRVPPYQCRTGCKYYRRDENTFKEYCELSNKIKCCDSCGDYEVNEGV